MPASHIHQPSRASAMIIDMNETNMSLYISKAFKKIAPFWPLKNLIAVNPLQGFEHLSFESAMEEGMHYFQQANLPAPLEKINRETIKWFQAFFDEGQATIKMPFRDKGLYQCFKRLALFDKNLNQDNLIESLPSTPEQAILICLKKLGINVEKTTEFLSLLLTTLPGWASYVCYKTEWSQTIADRCPATQADYLAVRIVITYLIWPNAIDLYYWHNDRKSISYKKAINNIIQEITKKENRYKVILIKLLERKKFFATTSDETPNAQLVFCIDVRSEPFRRAIEAQDNYETFGFAGFFGIPIKIKNELCENDYASCPVLLSPKHIINENISCENGLKNKILQKKQRIKTIKHLYQMLKYMFTTPFILVEALGLLSGLSMLTRTIAPITARRLNEKLLKFSQDKVPVSPSIENIHFEEQYLYAENFLRMIGLTKKFAPLIIICGHGADTQNNAYHSALDCGACGGRNGAPNARTLATILNDHKIRHYLAEKNIVIPEKTIFMPALHNTTTDEILLYQNKNFNLDASQSQSIKQLQMDLLSAREKNNQSRAKKLLFNNKDSAKRIQKRGSDWAQTRPEWGLAKNATFIVGPRNLTKNIHLNGRAFLHSYDWEEDQDGALLTTILTAPMIVAQWINNQYLFSTLDNVAYGSGSKVTHNITGKMAIIQGNASDLMHGLPLQSVNQTDKKIYHEPLRLLTVVYAPRHRIDAIIFKHDILKNLFGNGWVSLICIDPNDNLVHSFFE